MQNFISKLLLSLAIGPLGLAPSLAMASDSEAPDDTSGCQGDMLRNLARSLTEQIFPSSILEVGLQSVFFGRIVEIISGAYRDNGGVSNNWQWRFLAPDGSMGNLKFSGYNNEGGFENAQSAHSRITYINGAPQFRESFDPSLHSANRGSVYFNKEEASTKRYYVSEVERPRAANDKEWIYHLRIIRSDGSIDEKIQIPSRNLKNHEWAPVINARISHETPLIVSPGSVYQYGHDKILILRRADPLGSFQEFLPRNDKWSYCVIRENECAELRELAQFDLSTMERIPGQQLKIEYKKNGNQSFLNGQSPKVGSLIWDKHLERLLFVSDVLRGVGKYLQTELRDEIKTDVVWLMPVNPAGFVVDFYEDIVFDPSRFELVDPRPRLQPQ